MVEHYSIHGAVCPHCGHVSAASDSDGGLYDESITEWECGECLSEFNVRAHNQWSWTSEKKEANHE